MKNVARWRDDVEAAGRRRREATEQRNFALGGIWSRAAARADWSMSPCRAPTLKPMLLQRSVQQCHLRAWRLQEDDRALEGPLASRSRLAQRLTPSGGSRPTATCKLGHAHGGVVVARLLETSILLGDLRRKVSGDAAAFLGGIVAAKISCRRVNGIEPADALDVGNEADVEHAVGFVDDEQLERR